MVKYLTLWKKVPVSESVPTMSGPNRMSYIGGVIGLLLGVDVFQIVQVLYQGVTPLIDCYETAKVSDNNGN